MKTNFIRERLRRGQPVIGSFLGLQSPNVAELMAHAGFDFLVIETEHNALDSAEVEHILMAVSGTETVPMVRIPSASQVFIQRALDMGAMGIVVPSVRTPEEARAIVSATRYPPQGTRSWGPLRASGYTFDNEDYFNRANDNILVTLIIETKEAVENIEAIARVPGIDVLYLGPWDLCLSLGLNPLHQPHPEVEQVVEQMLAAGKAGAAAVGIGSSTPDQVRQRLAKGLTYITYGPDYSLMIAAARAGIEAFRAET